MNGAYRDGALDRPWGKRDALGGLGGPARLRIGVRAQPVDTVSALAVAAPAPVGMKLEMDLLARDEEAGAVERREVGPHQVLVDLDQTVFPVGAVEDEGFDLRLALPSGSNSEAACPFARACTKAWRWASVGAATSMPHSVIGDAELAGGSVGGFDQLRPAELAGRQPQADDARQDLEKVANPDAVYRGGRGEIARIG